MNCSPNNNKKNSYTCFNRKSLVKIANAYNSKNKNNKIKLVKNNKSLWNNIRSKLNKKCDKEWCWIDQDFIKEMNDKEIQEHTFIPKAPKSWKSNKYEWLSTTDINEVMKQYEKKYTDFLFVGPVPLDCYAGSKLSCELTNINVKKIFKSGINKLGVVYNLDYSFMTGSHWVSLFVNKDHKTITYFDSTGASPPDEIANLMIFFQNEFKKLNINLRSGYSKKQHQYGNTECGVYSMNYIIESLKGKKLYQINKKRIPDKIMNNMRKHLYRFD
jgi:hypothetical protein